MPASYALGDHFEQFIQTQIADGHYRNANEVLCDALRLLEEREQIRQQQLAQLRQKIQAGIDSGEGIPAESVFERLSEKYQALSKA